MQGHTVAEGEKNADRMEKLPGLVYESMPGMGTGVSVIIPAEEGEES